MGSKNTGSWKEQQGQGRLHACPACGSADQIMAQCVAWVHLDAWGRPCCPPQLADDGDTDPDGLLDDATACGVCGYVGHHHEFLPPLRSAFTLVAARGAGASREGEQS
jgi:hypothetical protein